MTDSRTTVAKHPVRGVLWGLVLGLGVAIYLILFGVIGIGTITGAIFNVVIVMAVFAVLGALWGTFGPAKKPKGSAPAEAASPPPAAEA